MDTVEPVLVVVSSWGAGGASPPRVGPLRATVVVVARDVVGDVGGGTEVRGGAAVVVVVADKAVVALRDDVALDGSVRTLRYNTPSPTKAMINTVVERRIGTFG